MTATRADARYQYLLDSADSVTAWSPLQGHGELEARARRLARLVAEVDAACLEGHLPGAWKNAATTETGG